MTTAEKISVKLKAAWAEGKFANSRRRDPEVQRRATAKMVATTFAKRILKTCEHCGVQWTEKPSHVWRRFCSRKCHSAAASRRIEKPCPGCGTLKLCRASQSPLLCKPCVFKRHSEFMKRSGMNPLKNETPEGRERRLSYLTSDENRKRVSALLKDVPKTLPSQKKFSPLHCCAVECWFRAPSGTVHYCRNMARFVHENLDLFNPEDVEQKAYGGKETKSYRCRATAGLSMVQRGYRGSWKGWTLVGHREGRERFDLIGRNFAKQKVETEEAD